MLIRPFFVMMVSGLMMMHQQPPPTQAPETPQTSPRETTTESGSTKRLARNARTEAPTSLSQPSELKKRAWEILQGGAKAKKTGDRAAAIHALGLMPHDSRGRRMAEAALADDAAEVRSAAAAALGEMGSRRSVPKLKAATDDKDPLVVLAAAQALVLLSDDSGYDVYYEVLTGERKAGKGVLSQAAAFKDPKKLAELGFQEGLGFIPFARLGWKAFKAIKPNDSSPARAAAALTLAKDPDPKTTEILANAAGDKHWIVRAAALEALAKRGDPAALSTVGLYLSDEEGEVRYTASATALRLMAIKKARSAGKPAKRGRHADG
jgi:HEAT repeat protein